MVDENTDRTSDFSHLLQVIAVWSLSYPEMTVLYASPAVERVYGYPPAAFAEDRGLLERVIHPDDRHRLEELKTTLQESGTAELEYRIVGPDGQVRWIMGQNTLVYDNTGAPARIECVASDITDRKNAELDLQERFKEREALRAIWETYSRGLAQEEFLQRAVECIPPGFRFPDACAAQLVVGDRHYASPGFQETPWHIEWGVRIDGDVFGTLTVVYLTEQPDADSGPFLDEELSLLEEISSWLGFMIRSDATQRQLTENERRVRMSQEYGRVGTWDWDIRTGEVYWSEQSAEWYGYTRREMHTDYEGFVNVVHPEDRVQVGEALRRCLETGEPYRVEHRTTQPDGSVRWLLEKGDVTYDEQSNPEHMFGVVQDITDRTRKEEEIRRQREFQTILATVATDFVGVDSSNLDEKINTALDRIGAFSAVDRAGVLLLSADCSQVSNTHFWIRPGTTLKGLDVEQLPVSEVPWFCQRLLDQRSVVHIPKVGDLPPEAASDRSVLRAMEMKSALFLPIYNENRVFGTIGFDTVTDYRYWTESEIEGLTVLAQIFSNALSTVDAEREILALRAQSEAARETAETANRAKTDFISSMSHELRTPLNAILGFGQLLASDTDLAPQHADFSREIVSAGNHLLNLVNEVLDLARIDSGRVDLSLEAVSCPEVITETVSLIEPFAEKEGIRLIAGPHEELCVIADRDRLKQVLVNLLSNAVKYNSPEGSVTVTLARDGETVRISVSDTGMGIPEEKRAELFTQFNRLGRESGEIEGSGIGLALSRRLVTLMGGTIGAESEPGTGSTFWIKLPVTDALCLEPEQPLGGSQRERSTTAETVTVLYIEDNPASVRLMEMVLSRHGGYELMTAHTGSLGLEMAELHRPSIVLADVNLPGIDGFEVLRRIRGTPWGRDLPVIALSADAMESAAHRGLEAGFSAYITKPIDVKYLLETLETVTSGSPPGRSDRA